MALPLPNQTESTHVLVVEDDELQTQILETALTGMGFEVDTVTSGLEALWLVHAGHYDIVLLDYQLLEIDGRSTAKLIDEVLGRKARPVLVALTATPEPLKFLESGLEHAFEVVLGKSLGLGPVLSALAHFVPSASESGAKRKADSLRRGRAWLHYDRERFQPGEDPSRPRILVVEDDEDQRMLLTSVLEERGYEVEAAGSGLEALRKIRTASYDVAVVDYTLPEIDGWAVANLVHNLMGQSVRPKLIALTATPTRLIGRGRMFDEVIGKSSDLQGLVQTVERLLRVSPNPATRRASLASPTTKPVSWNGRSTRTTPAVLTLVADNPGARYGSVPVGELFPPVVPHVGEKLPVLNSTAFVQAAGYFKPPALSRYLGSIVRRCEILLRGLREPITPGRFRNGIADEAHGLVGSAGMFGFERLASVAARFDHAIRTGSAEAPLLAETLSAALEMSLQEMQILHTPDGDLSRKKLVQS